jgi:sec-independent protein translocase protein TatC
MVSEEEEFIPKEEEDTPTVGEAVSEGGEAVSEGGEAVSEEGEAVSEEGEAVSEEGEAVSEEGEAVSEEGEAVSEEGEAVSEEGEAVSEEGEAVSEEGEAVSEEGEDISEEAELSYTGDDDPPTEEEEEDDDDGGGPVKSFLEHLEDLRWVLIKCMAAVIVGIVVCLVAGPQMAKILYRPLMKAPFNQHGTNQVAGFYFEDTQIGPNITLTSNKLGSLDLGTNSRIRIQLEPIELGEKVLFELKVSTNALPTPKNREISKVQLLNLSPLDGFIVALQIGIFGGLALSLPFVIFYISEFLVPALKRIEKKYLLRGLLIGSGLFITGILFCYLILLPAALNAAAKYSEWLGFTASQWRARDYIGFICKFMFGMGISFELPVVLLTFVKIGLVSYPTLAKSRPYAAVVTLILAAFLTPPDGLTQVMMAGPLYMLFEGSLLIAWYWHRKELAAEAKAEAEDA